MIQFFEMANQANLPLVLHIREAYEAMIELLNAHFTPPIRAVSHCFSGTREIMEKIFNRESPFCLFGFERFIL
jgi:TatD DNase family protein